MGTPKFHHLGWVILTAFSPYLARLPGELLGRLDWLSMYFQGNALGKIFVILANGVPGVVLMLSAMSLKPERLVLIPAIPTFAVLFLLHGLLDLRDSSMGGLALFLIPLLLATPVAIIMSAVTALVTSKERGRGRRAW